MSSQCRTLVKIKAAEGSAMELTQYIRNALPMLRQVDGLIDLQANVDEADTDTLYLVFTWESRDNETAYVASELYQDLVGRMAPLRREHVRIRLRVLG
jgi:quinol monooxygenase YgiN